RHRSHLSGQLAHPARSSDQQPIIVDAGAIEHLRREQPAERRPHSHFGGPTPQSCDPFWPSPHNIRSNTLSVLKEKPEARSNSSVRRSVGSPSRGFSKTVGFVQ